MRITKKDMLSMLAIGCIAVITGGINASASSGIDINEQNFPDAQIRQIATQYDSNKDQILDTSEQKKLTELIVNETTENTGVQGNVIRTAKGITSFKGVEYFAELKSISVGQSGKPQSSYKIASDLFQYTKQVKTIRVNYAYADPVDARYKDSDKQMLAKNTSIVIDDSMQCESLSLEGVQVQKMQIVSKKMKKLLIKTCNLPDEYTINTPNLQTLGLKETYVKKLQYGKMDKLKYLSLGLNVIQNGKEKASPVTVLDLQKNKNIAELSVTGCRINKLDLSSVNKTLRLASITQSGKYPIKQVRLGKMAALKGLSVSAKCAAIDASKCSRLNTLECASYGIFKVKLPKSVQYLTLTSLDKKGCKSLKLSNCKKLKALKVVGCKKLKTINLAKCSKLYSLQLRGLTLKRLTLPNNKNGLKTWLKNYDFAEVLDKQARLFEDTDYVYEPASSNYKILQNTSVKVLDLSRLTKVKHAKTTLKKAFLKNKKVKKVVISKKLSKHDKVWLQKKLS